MNFRFKKIQSVKIWGWTYFVFEWYIFIFSSISISSYTSIDFLDEICHTIEPAKTECFCHYLCDESITETNTARLKLYQANSLLFRRLFSSYYWTNYLVSINPLDIFYVSYYKNRKIVGVSFSPVIQYYFASQKHCVSKTTHSNYFIANFVNWHIHISKGILTMI